MRRRVSQTAHTDYQKANATLLDECQALKALNDKLTAQIAESYCENDQDTQQMAEMKEKLKKAENRAKTQEIEIDGLAKKLAVYMA
jgi:stress response protein YsnF